MCHVSEHGVRAGGIRIHSHIVFACRLCFSAYEAGVEGSGLGRMFSNGPFYGLNMCDPPHVRKSNRVNCLLALNRPFCILAFKLSGSAKSNRINYLQLILAIYWPTGNSWTTVVVAANRKKPYGLCENLIYTDSTRSYRFGTQPNYNYPFSTDHIRHRYAVGP